MLPSPSAHGLLLWCSTIFHGIRESPSSGAHADNGRGAPSSAITIAIAIATDSIPALAKSKVLVSVCSHTDPCTASCNLIPFPRPFSNSLTRFLFCLGSARFCFSFPCFGLSI
ncbi:XXYS1_4_G0007200.mRNA.1.CDS.1 [Saccharomyces cerevisiae]|nr:XXYS1_4_G0007200.mRNA.1.CDS.1 [Saccharomyces cerevisiae]